MQDDDQYLTARDLMALLVVGGLFIVLVLLMFFPVPKANEQQVGEILSIWGAGGFAVVLKHIFDGTKSSDTKNATIATMSAALASQVPPVDPAKVP